MATNRKDPVGYGAKGKPFYNQTKFNIATAEKRAAANDTARMNGTKGPGYQGSPPRAGAPKLPTDGSGGGTVYHTVPTVQPGHPVHGGPVTVHPTANGADTNAASVPSGGRPSNIIGH